MAIVESERAGAVVMAESRRPFDDYVRARSAGLLRLAWLVTRNPDDARDAVQDAFASLYPRWSRLPEGTRLEAYVGRSVVNACLAVLRRRRAESPTEPTFLGDLAARSGRRDPGPEEAALEADRVWRWCGDLPPVQRTALVLRFHSDLDYAEIGHRLGCRESTARSHVHRAIVALRVRLEEAGEDG